MSAQFEKQLVLDPRLQATSNIRFGVYKGAQNVTSAKYTANSNTSSSAVWNIAVPSQTTMIDTHVLLHSKLKITFSEAINSTKVASAAFPAHQWMTNVSATINSNQVSVNMNDCLEPIIRSLPKEQLFNFEGTCPVMADAYPEYTNGQAGYLNNPLLGYQASGMENYIHPNGAHPLIVDDEDNEILYLETVEPLLFSPFTFGRAESCESALYGVTNMSFNFNLGNVNRVIRVTSEELGAKTFTIEWAEAPELQFFFLTPSPSVAKRLNSLNNHKYYTLSRVITNGVAVSEGVDFNPGVATITSTTVQLNSIPDKLFIFTKLKNQNASKGDSHLTISNISLNWNNQSGLLANFSPQQLYQCSREAGIQQSWLDWSGVARGIDGDAVRTAGGILVLDFSKHIALQEDYLAPNSLGNYNLQMNVQVKNYGSALLGSAYDLYIIAMTSGVLSLDKGTAAVYTSLLSAEDVLSTADMEPMYKPDVDRFIGGSIFDNIRSALPKMLPVARQVLEMVPNQYAQAAAAGLKTLGYAKMGMQHRVK
jgi:hypothetical protein